MVWVVLLVEKLLIFVEVNYLAEGKENFDGVEAELTENGVVVLQTEVRNVNLHFFSHGVVRAELLLYFKETRFDFLLHTRIQLLLHVLNFKLLSHEQLKGLVIVLP